MENISFESERPKNFYDESKSPSIDYKSNSNRKINTVENLQVIKNCFNNSVNLEKQHNSITLSNNYLMECSSFDSKRNSLSFLNSPIQLRSITSRNENLLKSPFSCISKLDEELLKRESFKNRFKTRFKEEDNKLDFKIKLLNIEENQLEYKISDFNEKDTIKLNPEENDLKSCNSKEKDNKMYFEQQICSNDYNLFNLNTLFIVLIKIFNNEILEEEDLKIKIEELKILNLILQRKYNKKLTKNNFNLSPDKKKEIVNKILRTRSYKRPEECYKFIFSRAMKYLKKKTVFKYQENFYNYYFKQISEQHKIPLLNFNYPFTKSSKKNYRAFNGYYFGLVFTSQKFKEDFLNFIQNELVDNYRIEIEKKIKMVLFKWDRNFRTEKQIEIIIPKIKKYLLKNKKCKLPWNLKEVNFAIKRMVSIANNSKITKNI